MTPLTLKDLQNQVAHWSKKNFPNNLPHHPLLGCQEELGELAHAHLKMEQGIRGTPEELILAKMDAVGDIIIYLADYCERNNLNLEACVTSTWDVVKKRDWTKNKVDGKAS